jgi:hypothetical protein
MPKPWFWVSIRTPQPQFESYPRLSLLFDAFNNGPRPLIMASHSSPLGRRVAPLPKGRLPRPKRNDGNYVYSDLNLHSVHLSVLSDMGQGSAQHHVGPPQSSRKPFPS